MEFIQEDIATLHDFGDADPDASMEDIAVIVPLTAEDVGGDAVEHTFEVLASLEPSAVIVPLRADPGTVRTVDAWVRGLDVEGEVLWCNGPAVCRSLADAGIRVDGGKGLDTWIGLGVAAAEHDVMVMHDADAPSYAEAHVPRLAWPLERGFAFSKGYYARIEDGRLYGRLVRLLWAPLLAIIREAHSHPLLTYLDAFRYPLAGEFAVTAPIASRLRLHPGWGLEVGMLGEMFALAGPDGTAQVDLGRHRHDHRPVTGENGLAAMATDIAGALLSSLHAHGISVERSDIGQRYEAAASMYVERYAADATFNGLVYDKACERGQVARYRDAIERAGVPVRLPPFGGTSIEPDALRSAAIVRG